MRVILNVILNSNTCFVSPDRLTRTHLTLLDKTIQCIVNPELSVKRMGCTAFKRNASQIWSHGFFGPSVKKKENQALGARCGAIWRSFKICVPILSPPSAGARVFFSRVHMRKCLPNFRSIHLIRKARVSFGLRETSMNSWPGPLILAALF